jgi:hypothetical protein
MTRIIAEYYALALALVLDALGWVAFFCYAVTTLGDTP